MQSRIKKEVKKLGGEIMRDLHLVISYVLGDHCQKHCSVMIAVILKSFEKEITVETHYKALRNNMKDITAEQQIMINAQHALIKEDYNNIKFMRCFGIQTSKTQ
jgi:hypothetical protein